MTEANARNIAQIANVEAKSDRADKRSSLTLMPAPYVSLISWVAILSAIGLVGSGAQPAVTFVDQMIIITLLSFVVATPAGHWIMACNTDIGRIDNFKIRGDALIGPLLLTLMAGTFLYGSVLLVSPASAPVEIANALMLHNAMVLYWIALFIEITTPAKTRIAIFAIAPLLILYAVAAPNGVLHAHESAAILAFTMSCWASMALATNKMLDWRAESGNNSAAPHRQRSWRTAINHCSIPATLVIVAAFSASLNNFSGPIPPTVLAVLFTTSVSVLPVFYFLLFLLRTNIGPTLAEFRRTVAPGHTFKQILRARRDLSTCLIGVLRDAAFGQLAYGIVILGFAERLLAAAGLESAQLAHFAAAFLLAVLIANFLFVQSILKAIGGAKTQTIMGLIFPILTLVGLTAGIGIAPAELALHEALIVAGGIAIFFGAVTIGWSINHQPYLTFAQNYFGIAGPSR